MKTAAVYGGVVAFANATLMILLYFFGFHNKPDHFLLGMALGMLGAIVITAVGLVLGIRAIRAENGPGAFSYGQALLAGLKVTLFCAVFGTAFQIAYTKFINPAYNETAVQWAQEMMERGNMPSGEIDERVEDMRKKFGIGYQVRNGLIFGLAYGGVVSLIAAAVLKRKPDSDEPSAA